MVTVTLTIPDAIAAELNAYAQSMKNADGTQQFANAKQMMIAYLKAELKAARQAAITQQVATVDDAVIT
jgi:hypothetical protein